MKAWKWGSLLLVLTLMLSAGAAVAATQAQLNRDMAVYAGPGTEYASELGVWPRRTPVIVIAVVENNSGVKWAHVEFSDESGLYRGYTELSHLQTYGTAVSEKYRGYDAFMVSDATVYYGPGYQYVARGLGIGRGTPAYVIDTENSFALIEYTENGREVRGYVESSLVKTDREMEQEFESSHPTSGASGSYQPGQYGPGTPQGSAYGVTTYDMGVPYLYGRSYGPDQMNIYILWVQTQLKAAGYYQGSHWDITGHLGDQTRSEIQRFMRSRGYYSHNGYVDQSVVDELAQALAGRTVPVYIGGYYDYMAPLYYDVSICGMTRLVSNMRDNIPHVTEGARWVQVVLSRLGYYTMGIDSKYGLGTENAVKAFQRAYGFEERDYVTLGVARAMMEAYYQSGGNLGALR